MVFVTSFPVGRRSIVISVCLSVYLPLAFIKIHIQNFTKFPINSGPVHFWR